jgi:hypothetical protein
LQNWQLAVGCRGRMIAAMITGLASTIAQRMMGIFAERTLASKSWASHHMICPVLSGVVHFITNL